MINNSVGFELNLRKCAAERKREIQREEKKVPMCERRKKIKLEKVGVREKKTEWVYEENIRKRESEVRGEIERERER